MFGVRWLLLDPVAEKIFGGAVPVVIAWATAALIAFRPVIKGPGVRHLSADAT